MDVRVTAKRTRDSEPGKTNLPFISELLRSGGTMEHSLVNTVELPLKPDEQLGATGGTEMAVSRHQESFLKTGMLYKTTLSRKEGARPGPTRQRQFRLTEVALEYFHHFNTVKIKRSFPLTSIEEVKYDEEASEPTTFQLYFSNGIETLRADSREEAKDWVEKIVEACEKWDALPTEETVFDESESEDDLVAEPVLHEDEDALKTSRVEVDDKPSKYRFSAQKFRKRSCSNPIQQTADDRIKYVANRHAYTTGSNNKKWTRRAFRQRTVLDIKSDHSVPGTAGSTELEKRDDFSMMKYPRRRFSLPSEKVFKMDAKHMQIMWRRNQHSKFHRSRSLSLHRVVEVREGQNTEMFDKFPYEVVEEQSFSLLYQQEDKKYAYLTSLNLICDHPDNYKMWMRELKSSVASLTCNSTQPRLSSEGNDNTDITLLWLKQLWSCKSEGDELPENEAIKLAVKLNPFVDKREARSRLSKAHEYQINSSRGLSLDFSGFVLMFNMLDDIENSNLFSVFKEYAKSSDFGMTFKEFREFLINECCWQQSSCTRSALRTLMQFHDLHHKAFKKFVAKNDSEAFVESRKLLSFAGFVSFLRSQDNSAIDPEHETVYQDMTQPLSHYFINSSHNTYLEGHQLNGKSSTEAYTRVLLQGCRCIEIDCWDDTLNVMRLPAREPIIYHGHTLTTKLAFRDVIHTIKDYGFESSPYPLVISIENHCNKEHQVKMADIFRAIFDDMLPKENLVELTGRTRLPSPEELRKKIILKSTMITIKPKSTLEKAKSATIKMGLRKKTSVEGQGEARTDNKTPQTLSPAEEEADGATQKRHSSGIHLSFSHSSEQQRLERDVREREKEMDDQEVKYAEQIDEGLSSLIVYAKGTSIKPHWSWEEQRATNVTQMFSFGEPRAVDLCSKDNMKDMLACTERQFVRTYPKGTSFDSSNYDPMPMWRCGVQMVSLNFQYPDTFMHLNQGFFRRNGGCGYVLKPAVMRRENPGGGPTPFDPKMTKPHPDVPPIDFEIELISGQRLCQWKKKCSSLAVSIHTYGIEHDCDQESINEATNDGTISNWPQWNRGKHILKKSIYMPELCLVYFCVKANGKMFGQNCIPLVSLQRGIKFIPLRTPGGELIPGSGLFVKIKKEVEATELTSETAPQTSTGQSSNRMKRQEAIEVINDDGTTEKDETVSSSHQSEPSRDIAQRRFTIPALLDTCPLPRDRDEVTVVAEVHENVGL